MVLSSCCRCYTIDATRNHLPEDVDGLGLEAILVRPHLPLIKELPEIKTVLEEPNPNPKSLELLQRGGQIFESMNRGGPEHTAALAMLADAQQRLGKYKDAKETIGVLGEFSSSLVQSVVLNLAQAKVLWYQGEFEESKKLCLELQDLPEMNDSPLFRCSALSGEAICQLMLLGNDNVDLQPVDKTREHFRIAAKLLQTDKQPLSCAAAYSNYGVAEAIYGITVARIREQANPQMDNALQAWRNALQMLDSFSKNVAVSESMRARINANIGWTLIIENRSKQDLKLASQYSGEAITGFETLEKAAPDRTRAGLGRALYLAATCYHLAGEAVTAEGLFQTAIDHTKKCAATSPLSVLDCRDAYQSYAKLCKEWEKRERDSERLEEKAKEMDESLSEGWKRKAGIHSGLWFWTPGDFL
jgi:tetratricopeptide (TPR) repeat protein